MVEENELNFESGSAHVPCSCAPRASSPCAQAASTLVNACLLTPQRSQEVVVADLGCSSFCAALAPCSLVRSQGACGHAGWHGAGEPRVSWLLQLSSGPGGVPGQWRSYWRHFSSIACFRKGEQLGLTFWNSSLDVLKCLGIAYICFPSHVVLL